MTQRASDRSRMLMMAGSMLDEARLAAGASSGLKAELRKILEAGEWTVVTAPSPDILRPGRISYTVGLTARGLPEAFVFGLAPQVGRELLTGYRELALKDLASGWPPTSVGTLLTGIANVPTLCLPADLELADEVCDGMGLPENRHPSIPRRAVQLVWPDLRGRFPTEPLCDAYCQSTQLPYLVPGAYD